MAMFKEAADIKTSDQLNLPVPQAKFETVVVKPSEIQQDMVQALSERAAEVHSGSVDPSVDNMLKITSDGRKIGLDQRLMNSALPDDPSSKLNACVNNVLRIWNDTKEQKLTQLIFCDMSTPKGDGSFNVYDDIRSKLLNAGVPEQEIEFIHNADTENKKAELFSKVRSGQVRVLLGSTAKMGAGTNVQTLLVAVHHLDVGWRPSDMTQRNGRIIRQGNQNKQVYVYNYVTESTFDAYLYQTLENKQKFISQIMTSKSPMRSCDDIDEQALSYAEIKALCAGDPRIREKMDLDVQVAKLKVLRGDFQNQKYRLEDKLLKTFPEEIQKQKTRITALQQDSQIAAAHPQDKENFCGMTIKGVVYDDKKTAGERLLLARQEMPNADMMLLGTYRGFELNIRFDSFKNEHQAVLRAELSYPVSLGDDAHGNITRLDNAIDNFADRIADAENALQNLEQQKQAAEVEVAKPFAQEEELAEKSARLAELNALLNIDRDRSSSQDAPEETEETETPATRPSVLAALGEKTNQSEPVKPFRSYYDKDGDEYVANEPKVSFRNGQFIVTDGQHTIEGRILRNGGKDLPILCKVYTGMTVEQEALLFAEQNGFSAPLTAGIRLRAKVVGGDAISKAFLAATNRVGLSLNYDSQQLTDYRIGCVGTAFRLYKQMGEPLYCETMRLIVAAWEGKPDSFRASVLKGMMHFVELYHGEFSEERLLRALRNIHPVDIYRIGQDDPAKLRGWKKYVFPIYTAYNGKCRKDALPMKF